MFKTNSEKDNPELKTVVGRGKLLYYLFQEQSQWYTVSGSGFQKKQNCEEPWVSTSGKNMALKKGDINLKSKYDSSWANTITKYMKWSNYETIRLNNEKINYRIHSYISRFHL